MGLEAFGFIDDMVDTNPLGTDPVSEGDDHLRGIKESVQGNLAGDVNTTKLLTNALVSLDTNTEGVQVRSTVPGSTILRLRNDVAARVADLLVNAAGLLRIVVATLGEALELRGSNAGVNDETMASFVPGGAATLNFAGVASVRSASFGGESTGQHRVTEALPLNVADLTRKDYVNNWSRSNIADQRIEVQNLMVLASTQTGGGTALNVTFSTPFTAVPAVTLTAEGVGFASLTTVTTTGFSGVRSVGGETIDWIAVGTNDRSLT